MTYEEILTAYLAKAGLEFRVWSRPADCKPDPDWPEYEMEPAKVRAPYGNREYSVRVYNVSAEQHFMDNAILWIAFLFYSVSHGFNFGKAARLIGVRRGPRWIPCMAYTSWRSTRDAAVSNALSELHTYAGCGMLPDIGSGWASPEECELRLEAYGVL